jgi:hypothetical protein
VSVPADTLAFLYLSGFLTPASFSVEVLSKIAGVLVVWYLLKLRADNAAPTAAA